MKIKEKDRLILINQYKILSSLNPKNEKNDQEKNKILENGYEKLYASLFENLSNKPLSNSECNFVMDVLKMYGTGITLSSNNLTNTSLRTNDLHFLRFALNEEIKYYSFAFFWLKTLNKYDKIRQIAKRNYKGIAGNVNAFEKRIARWKSFHKYLLSEDQITGLIQIN